MLREHWLGGRKTRRFTLQWHLTNACDHDCRHCYDRTHKDGLPFQTALAVLADFLRFCSRHRVRGHISLTGGNPVLYPHFMELYRSIATLDVDISLLGNPIDRTLLAMIAGVRIPNCYQVSLEGLAAHNDEIRGPGSFRRTLQFLDLLREHGVHSHVMLTLTRSNMDQVVPLGEMLRGRTGRLTFNRLAQVGRGSHLQQPSMEEYATLLKRYVHASHHNPVLGFKDNLFNIMRHHFHRPLLGGCTGFGCGAAFNFVAVLPDGEIHACRKFPSPIGHVLEGGIHGAWHSSAARTYRKGSSACHTCTIKEVCRGCLAVMHGQGLDVQQARDPHCFMKERTRLLHDL